MTRDLPEDKDRDVSLYEKRARNQLTEAVGTEARARGAWSVAPIYRAPYLYYEQCIHDLVGNGQEVLELGAGTGVQTPALLRTGAVVTATDLSPSALAILERSLSASAPGRLRTRVADMESLPFDDASFDVVACAGSLSYGDPAIVDAGILRVLKPGGSLVLVDSLNHNPAYRFNRWLQYRRGARTGNTLRRMPTIERLESLGRRFQSFSIRYFGALSWATPLLGRIVGPDRAAAFSDWADETLRVERSAFKFVLVARGR